MKPLWTLFLVLAVTIWMPGCGGSGGNAPTAADIERALRAIHEKPASPGMDGAVTVEVQSVKIGERRKWHYQDGGDATPNTDLWSARVHLLVKTHYRTRTMVFDWDKPCSVFKNGLGEWQVSFAAGASKDSVYDLPADMGSASDGALGPRR